MKKQNKRKGFALLEMLAVIGIVGALVAVIIPTVTGNDVRARAAANAANLRSIEAQVEMAILENPEDFDAFLEQGERLQAASDGILGKIYDFVFGDGEAEASRANYNFLADNGGRQIIIPRSGKVVPNVATAKGLEAPTRSGGAPMVVADKTGMKVYITAEGAIAAYGDYTKEDFADVAEDGYYDGFVKGDGSGEDGDGGFIDGVKDWLDEKTCQSTLLDGKHSPGANCKCPYCGATAHWDADRRVDGLGLIHYDSSSTRHGCTECGEKYLFNADHKFSGSHDCVYTDCEYVSPCEDVDPEDNGFIGIGGDKEDHKCYMCGGDNNHQWCTTDDSGGGSLFNPKPDHKCDTCGYQMSNCTFSPVEDDATKHRCSKCEATATHSYVNGKCNDCGKTLPTCKWSTCTSTDVKSDGYCGSHQQKSCTVKVLGKNFWGQTELQTCSGKYRDTTADCSNASNHHKCTFTPVANDATKHECSCGDTQTHSYSNGVCTACGKTLPTCKFDGCSSTDVKSDEYCGTHQEKDCPKNVTGTSWGQTVLKDCSGKYRDPNAGKCTATHYKEVEYTCTVGKTSWIGTASQCDNCKEYHKKGTSNTYTKIEVDNS